MSEDCDIQGLIEYLSDQRRNSPIDENGRFKYHKWRDGIEDLLSKNEDALRWRALMRAKDQLESKNIFK